MFTPKDSLSAPQISAPILPTDEREAAKDLNLSLQTFYDQPNQYYYSLELFAFAQKMVVYIISGRADPDAAKKLPIYNGWMFMGVQHAAIKAWDFCAALFALNNKRKNCPSIDKFILGSDMEDIIARVAQKFPRAQTKPSRHAASHAVDINNTRQRNSQNDTFINAYIENDTFINTVNGEIVKHRACHENLQFMREVVTEVDTIFNSAINQMTKKSASSP